MTYLLLMSLTHTHPLRDPPHHRPHRLPNPPPAVQLNTSDDELTPAQRPPQARAPSDIDDEVEEWARDRF